MPEIIGEHLVKIFLVVSTRGSVKAYTRSDHVTKKMTGHGFGVAKHFKVAKIIEFEVPEDFQHTYTPEEWAETHPARGRYGYPVQQ